LEQSGETKPEKNMFYSTFMKLESYWFQKSPGNKNMLVPCCDMMAMPCSEMLPREDYWGKIKERKILDDLMGSSSYDEMIR